MNWEKCKFLNESGYVISFGLWDGDRMEIEEV